ncbi:PREDICTED: uncharacterized protein LOC109463761 [Branchiostoma belcheri]|uniref:Voltage-gated hydrogen channel 1 n=1 Tax=Branchiostoma belcheri TaxID=7741 RepID=A0A6P4Y0M2_BRABE|nr:PREDICTED: uncharacterized protein LOC109463761 [Branchiostoma belcheri]
MTPCDGEKKPPPSGEATVGGIFPDEIAVIKKQAQNDKRRPLKIVIIAGVAVMAVLAIGVLLLITRPSRHGVVTCSLNFWTGKQLLHETVETDKDAETDAFYTEGSRGEAAVMYDHSSMMKAFKLSRSNKTCFIFEETQGEKNAVKKTAEELEEKQDGSLQFAEYGGAMLMTVDTERPARPVLSQKLQNFCGQLEPRWAKLTPATEEEQQGDRVEIIMPAEARDMGELAEMPVGPGNEKETPPTPSSTHPLTESRDHHHDNQDCRHKLKHMLERQSVHIAIVVLIVLDTLIVIMELLIDVRVIKLCPDPPDVCVPKAGHNGTTGLVTTGAPGHHVIDAGDHGTGGHEECHHVLIEVLHVVSILILCIFVVEIALKIYVDRLEFFKNGFHVLDAVVVLVSLGLDIASLVRPSAFTDAGGLLILLRLWRITRIVNGIIISVEEEWEHKVNHLKHEHQLVERERDRLLKENALLQKTLTNHGIDIPKLPPDSGDESTCEFEFE